MRRRTILNFVGAVAFCLATAVGASAQDFQRSYNLGNGAEVEIANVSGDIELKGYDGSALVVNAYKTGRDRDQVEVEDESTPGRVSLRARYPNNCNCDASVRFEVSVPRSASLNFDRISTASGNLRAEGFSGRLHLSTASGNVSVTRVGGEIKANSASGTVRVADATGTVNANSASGDVEVELTQLDGGNGAMRFSSASGDVHVRLPSNIDATVSMATASGDIETSFPIEVRTEPNGRGKRAEGQLGNGSRTLKISSASGNVSLKSI
ncbi:MAG TPA: DUF4097 family beta strand repeat-containing protein [Pyrinomonadaceae bacterium]